MARLSLGEEQAVRALAEFLYAFLPGEPHPYANRAISFRAVAFDLGLGAYWTGGSKQPAIAALLSRTLSERRNHFCPLILEVVRRAMHYPKGPTITRERVESLNALILPTGFKIPELYDPAFLRNLPSGAREAPDASWEQRSRELKQQLLALDRLEPQRRGYEFEAFLNALFTASRMAPRSPFRCTGEQIDGSFDLAGDTYLVEARWRGARLSEADLLVFDGKVRGKAAWSRGLYVSMSGFTAEGLEAFARGKRTQIICVDGLDLHAVLERALDLAHVFKLKARRAAETNDAFVSVRDLIPGA